jgi:ribose-phosphate pyrophosphokinase
MIVFAFADYERLLGQLDPVPQRGAFEIGRFENGELFLSILSPVRTAHCVVLGSIAPPDERLLSLALLAHTLRKEGSTKVTAFLPYLAYSRQDKAKPGKSLAAAWVGSLLQASSIDEVFTIDVHSERDKQSFPIPLTSTFPAELFGHAIKKYQLTDATLVAPDNGAIPRCQAIHNSLGRPDADITYFEKKRDETGITHTGLFGNVGTRALIIDDMLDTGATLVSACEKLVQAGAREIYIMVTHGLFTGPGWKKLWSFRVQRIFCTETVPATEDILNEPRITRLPIAHLLQEQFSLLQEKRFGPVLTRGSL